MTLEKHINMLDNQHDKGCLLENARVSVGCEEEEEDEEEDVNDEDADGGGVKSSRTRQHMTI